MTAGRRPRHPVVAGDDLPRRRDSLAVGFQIAGMSEDGHVGAGCCRVEILLPEFVNDVNTPPPMSTSSVPGNAFAQPPLSTLPPIAHTGQRFCGTAITSTEPMSPAWMIMPVPRRQTAASGRSSPWVSEVKPMRVVSVARLVQAQLRPLTSRKASSMAKAAAVMSTRIQMRPGSVCPVCHSSVPRATRHSNAPVSESQRGLPGQSPAGHCPR